MATSDTDMEAEVSKMRAKEIREELQSYGISTKTFFEKSELEDALVKARKEGKTPINGVNGAASSSSASSDKAGSSDSTTSTASSSRASSGNRLERIQQEMEKCKGMKVGELKKELESYGVSTKSYFEKSEFVRAVAEARVDGVKKGSGASRSSGSGGRQKQPEEPRDPSFRDVVVSKFTGDKRMMLGGAVIDVKAR